MTHICVVELSHPCFSQWHVVLPVPSHYLKQCWYIVNWTLKNKSQWSFHQNTTIFAQGNAFENCVCEMAAILSRGKWVISLRWRRNGHARVSIHQPHHCLLNRLVGCRSKKSAKLRVTGLCVGNSPGTGEFPAQMASNEKNVSIWWRHHVVFGHN